MVTLAGDVPNYLLLMGTRKLRLNHMRIELHPRSRHHPGTETPYDSLQGFLRHQHRFRLLRGGSRLLLWICNTFWPTRSGSGNAQAAQEPLRARLLLHILQSSPQARLHP